MIDDWIILPYPLIRYKDVSVIEFAAQDEIQCRQCGASIESNRKLVRTGLSSFLFAFACTTCELMFAGRASSNVLSVDPREYH